MPVGPSPFNKAEFDDWYSKRRHPVNAVKYKFDVKRTERALRNSLTGDTYKLPKQDKKELAKFFGEHQSELSQGYLNGEKLYKSINTPADYIDYAFNQETQQKNIYTQQCKGGHIDKLTYNPVFMLLMVEFAYRHDICVFFNLPSNVAATLMVLAQNNTMAPPSKNGRERHAVGVEFWNLVRVRGSIHDTRYPFEYTNDFRTGQAFGRREGSGVHGEGNKWVYDTSRRLDKRYKVNKDDYTGADRGRSVEDPEAHVTTSPLRIDKAEYEKAQTYYADERKRDYYEGEESDIITDSDLVEYFENSGAYEADLGRAGANTAKVKAYHDLYDAYENMSMEPNELAKKLRALGAII